MGLSRDTFYRYKSAVEEGGVEALLDGNRRKPNLANRVDMAVEEAVVAYDFEHPAHGNIEPAMNSGNAGYLFRAVVFAVFGYAMISPISVID